VAACLAALAGDRRQDAALALRARSWRDGSRVAGRAPFLLRGEHVATAAYQLTEEQREYFRDYRSVAATPIQDGLGRRFGA
jgi:hypothetical protein